MKTFLTLFATVALMTGVASAEPIQTVTGNLNLNVGAKVTGAIGSNSSSGSEFLNNFSMGAQNTGTKANFSSTGYGHNIAGFTNGANNTFNTFSTSTHTNTTSFNLPKGMETNGEVLSGANGTSNYSLTGNLKTDVKLSDVKFNTSMGNTTTNNGTTTDSSLTSVPSYDGSGYTNLTGAKVLGTVAGKNGTFYILGTGSDLQGTNSTGNYFNAFGNDQSTIY